MNYETILNQQIQEVQPSGIRKFFDILEEMKDAISLGIGRARLCRHPGTSGMRASTPWSRGYTKYTSNAGMARAAAGDRQPIWTAAST